MNKLSALALPPMRAQKSKRRYVGLIVTVAMSFLTCRCGSQSEPGSAGVVEDGGGATGPADAGWVDFHDAAESGPADTGGNDGGDELCVFTPTGSFDPDEECRWDEPAPSQPYPLLTSVVSMPIVLNLTDDDGDGKVDTNDIPDIAFTSYQINKTGCVEGQVCSFVGSAVLRVVSGRCGDDGLLREHFSVGPAEIEAATGEPDIWLDNSSALAGGDLDGDGVPELVGMIRGGGTIAFRNDGSVMWLQTEHPARKSKDFLAGGSPSLADLNGDGYPEVIIGRVALRGTDGSLLWRGEEGVGNNGFLGPMSTVADVDLDGRPNVLAGSTMYEPDGTVAWTYFYPTEATSANCATGAHPCDGFSATANLDDDDEGEVVIVRAGVVYLLNHDGTEVEVGGRPARVPLPGDDCDKGNEGGPPTVADFDGDGLAEIGTAGADFYVVVDLECFAEPLPSFCAGDGIRWKVPNFDCSSRVTSSSVFDFEGDGKAEVIYNDEKQFRVFDGTTGEERFSLNNNSHTRLEMPVIADVDNDGNSEIVFIETGEKKHGVRVWGDASDSWVPTRRIWNQHAYHVTNVSESGTIPATESVNWLAATEHTISGRMNNFRQNLPEVDVLLAPDLTLALDINNATCPGYLTIDAEVCNEGAIVVGPGVEVKFWLSPSRLPVHCGNSPVKTTKSLEPGQCETIRCEWEDVPMDGRSLTVHGCADNGDFDCGGGSPGGNNECREQNNAGDASGEACTGQT